MKRFLPSLSIGLIIAGGMPVAWGQENGDKMMDAFLKKVSDKEAAMAQKNAYPNENALSTRIKTLKVLIARGDTEGAMQLLGREGMYGLTPDLQEAWLKMTETLIKELKEKQAAQQEKLRMDVDQLVIDGRTACLEAKKASDLDAIIVRCAALQSDRERGNTILTERTTEKLRGTAQALITWAKYLDFREAGNNRAANNALKSLTSNESQFPLLKMEEINARFLPAPPENMDGGTVLLEFFRGKNPVDDLPKIIEQVNAYMANPANVQVVGQLRGELKKLEALNRASEAIGRGDVESAQVALDTFSSMGITVQMQEMLLPVRSEIEGKILQSQAKKWTQLTMNPGEDKSEYVSRIVEELSAKGDYAKLVEVLAYSDKLGRSRSGAGGASASTLVERAAIERYLAAQRFEAAGDYLSAINSYRAVVGSSGARVPVKQAEEALKRLLEKHPEAASDANVLVLEELRSMKQQMQSMMGRAMNRPYP